MFNFPARAYNDVMAMIRRFRPLSGMNSRIKETQAGILISPALRPINWDHPWTIHPKWVEDDNGNGSWTVTVTPGFVNGVDVVIGSDEIPLTAATSPVLKVANFRDATGVGGAYPAIFKKLGASEPVAADQVPDSLDGTIQVNVELFPQQYGTRRLAAADFLLHVDHAGTYTDTTYADPDTGNLVIHSTAFISALDRYPYRLSAVSEFLEPQYPTVLDRLLGTADEPNYDELKLATLWLLSPPDESDDSSPGPTWVSASAGFSISFLRCASTSYPRKGCPPVHFPFLRAALILSRVRSEMISRSNWAKERRMFSVNRPPHAHLSWN